MADVREILRGRLGKPIAITVILLGVVLVAKATWDTLGASKASSLSRERMFICSQTGKPFEYRIKLGDGVPVMSPYSSKKTGYPAEFCYWTADGRSKEEPTLVLLNKYLSKTDPTFCPDCNRLVVGLNPAPEPGRKPPVTRVEYEARKQPRGEEL